MSARASLLRWLGPWSGEDKSPPDVSCEEVALAGAGDDRPMKLWIYRGQRAPRSRYLLAPGLHYAGPADPRMDRFCRILAHSGHEVYAPFLPDFAQLLVRTTLTRDLERGLEVLLDRGDRDLPVRIFSISFGSLPALRLASSPEHSESIERLVVFGGYADWRGTIDYCLTGTIDGKPHGVRDPLNQPVVFLNVMETIDGAPTGEDRALVEEAWRSYVRRTWGRPEMKEDGVYQKVAREVGAHLPARLRPLYDLGCGLEPGAHAVCTTALERMGAAELLDPRPQLGGLRCRVVLVHGMDDDVIPYPQAALLESAIQLSSRAPVERYITGLYGHTRGAAQGGAALIRELSRFVRIAGRIA